MSTEKNERIIYKLHPKAGEVVDRVWCPDGTEPHGLTWDGTHLWYDDTGGRRIH
ncbi:MAG: hypothetical protein HY709_05345, partial [Candidatus Latescibacteria bacterium]|nr:hypothetical protein [Candidatus Latescibacterota bacterium]